MSCAEGKFLDIIAQTPFINDAVKLCAEYGLPQCYIAGGALTQTIWNNQSKRPACENIKDIDVVYFETHSGAEEERKYNRILNDLFPHEIDLDIKNQALVHKWYPQKFGKEIAPYKSSRDAISSWLPAFSVGVAIGKSKLLEVYAPHGLEDLFAKRIRPNKKVISEAVYIQMCGSYKRRWSDIEIIEWDI